MNRLRHSAPIKHGSRPPVRSSHSCMYGLRIREDGTAMKQKSKTFYMESKRQHSDPTNELIAKEKEDKTFLITERKSQLWSAGNAHNNDSIVQERFRRRLSKRRRMCLNKTENNKVDDKESPPTCPECDFNSVEKKLRRFRSLVKCVIILVKMLNVIIDISNEKTTRTAAEEHWHTLYTGREARKLAFNKSIYAKERAFAKVPTWALKIFDRTPDSRTEIECRRVHALLRGLKSFDKFTERIQLYMCRSFRYQRVEPGRVILRRGHVGFNFYFIYSGSVFVNVEDYNTDGKPFEKTETVLVRGDSFGELALLQDIRRTASITCRETCEVLVVDKETFAKVCPTIFEEELDEKEHFLSRLPLFSPKYWRKDMLKALCMEAQIQEYKTNKVVATDSKEEEWMYICMENESRKETRDLLQGKCQVIRRLILDRAVKNRRKKLKQNSSSVLGEHGEVDIQNRSSDSDSSQGTDTDTSEDADEEGRDRMLVSMSLEYRKDGRRKKVTKAEEELIKKRETTSMVVTGPTTLTSFISTDKEFAGNRDFVYLNIATMRKDDIFNLYDIVNPETQSTDCNLILVSCGARFLRIKKKTFLTITTKAALEHAKLVGKGKRYPMEEQLYASYEAKLKWDQYKDKIIEEVLENRHHRRHRFRLPSFKNHPHVYKERRNTVELIKALKQRSLTEIHPSRQS